MITVQCVKCGFNNKLVFNQKLAGKKVKFLCKNPTCEESNTYTFPQEKTENNYYETVVSDYNPNSLSEGFITWYDDQNEEKINFPITVGVNIIGRASSRKKPDLAIPTSDKTMSRLHCVIVCVQEHNGMSYLLKEYSNKNTLLLNDKKLHAGSEVYLQTGDRIHLGKTVISFNI